MKKSIALLLFLIFILSLAGCNKTPASVDGGTTPNSDSTSTTTNNTQDKTNTTEGNDDAITPDTWGVSDQFAADNDKPSESFYINFPNYAGTSHGYGLIADQSNDTAALVSGQNDYAPQISGISELFPAYFEQLEYTLQKRYGMRASEFKLSLTDDKATNVGDYAMHMFNGTIEFKYEDSPRKYCFVAYATTLKSNGAYAYWVVYDTSDGQKNAALIAEHALNMAKTFREEQ